MTGTIRTLHHDKAFGFIQTSSEGDYFFHRSAVQAPANFGELTVGQRVEFTPQRGDKGPRAEQVRVVDDE